MSRVSLDSISRINHVCGGKITAKERIQETFYRKVIDLDDAEWLLAETFILLSFSIMGIDTELQWRFAFNLCHL